MTKNQEETILRLIEYVKSDESILGLILCGSIAKGTETDRSDIDLFVVVTEERFNDEKVKKNYFWGMNLDAEEFKTEVDGKIISKDFLKKIWNFGNESIKNTLYYSKLIYTVDHEIEELLSHKAPQLVNDKTENIRKFYALMKSSRYSVDGNWDNRLFVNKCIYDTVFYACRLVLAHNDVLFPCAKNLSKALGQCKKIPKDFSELMDNVLRSYSLETLDRFYHCVEQYFREYHFDDRIRKGYVLENELFWYFHALPYDEI